MRRFAKVTVSLPVPLLEEIERSLDQRGESRSEAIARLLGAALRGEREQADVERYVKGYLGHPDTEEEMTIADRLSAEAASLDPWP